MKGRVAIRIVFIAVLYAFAYFAYALFSLQGSLKDFLTNWDSLLYVAVLVILSAMAIVWLLGKIRIPLREKAGGSLPFLLSGSIILALMMLFTVIGGMLYRLIFQPGLIPGELAEAHPGFILQILVISMLTGIVIAVADHSLDSYSHLQELSLSTRKLETEQLNLRFESLRSQISPHFLFNSLNTIASLIYRDVSMAERFIRNLASVYLSVLKNYELPLVPLKEELKLAEHYSYLMQVRFEDAFFLETELDRDAAVRLVPPLSIQMLVENAIKHNRMSKDNPLRIRITTEEDYLVVRNNFIGHTDHINIGKDLYRKPAKAASPGIGLQNIKSRYRMLSDKPVQIRKDEYFTVAIPLIPNNGAEMVHS